MAAEKQAEGIRKFAADAVKLEKFGGSSASRTVLKCRQSRVDVTSPAERTIRQLGIAVAIVLFEAHEASKKQRSNVE